MPVYPDTDGSNDNIVLKVTPNHPIYVYSSSDKGSSYLYTTSIGGVGTDSSLKLKEAGDLVIGDRVHLFNGETAKVTSISSVDEQVSTGNLVIETYHNYFADNVLVDDKYGFDDIDEETKPDKDDSGVSLDMPIKVTTLEDENNPSSLLEPTICFGYYDEIEYSSTYLKESSATQRSSGKINTIISNIINMLLEKFPALERFGFFQRYLDRVDDDTPDTLPDNDETPDTLPDNDETPDTLPDNDGGSDNIPPFGIEQRENPLNSMFVSIIEEDSEDPDELIHYIWDFGDNTYKYGKDATHNYDLGHPSALNDEVSFSGYSTGSETFDEIVTYLVTLIIVDKYGNIVDMDMTSITIESTWSADETGYSLIDYSINF